MTLTEFIQKNGKVEILQSGFTSDMIFHRVWTLEPKTLPTNLVYEAKDIFDRYLRGNGTFQTTTYGLNCYNAGIGYFGNRYTYTELFYRQ